jgi:hypothetical protein
MPALLQNPDLASLRFGHLSLEKRDQSEVGRTGQNQEEKIV